MAPAGQRGPGERAPQPASGLAGPARRITRSPVFRHLVILACYLAAGIAFTWPRGLLLVQGKLQATRDAGVYVWDFWWMAHQILHFGNPWFTRAIAAPVGAQLGYHALMPLEGVVMLPVTLAFGPSASYNLLSILMPGLMCYAMYRAARLWLPGQLGPLTAGALFGLSSEMTWHDWYQLNLAVGVLFLPVALEAAIRLRRTPRWPQAVFLGLAVGGSLLSDQQSAVLVIILVAVLLLPWLFGANGWGGIGSDGIGSDGTAAARQPWRVKLAATAGAILAGLVVASPQIAAMVAQTRSGGAAIPPQLVNFYYASSGSYLPGLFTLSPRVVQAGLHPLAPATYQHPIRDGVPTFGVMLSTLALLGLVAAWRRRSAWLFAVLWLGSAALALGTSVRIGTHIYIPAAQNWTGTRVSAIMPFTWFVHLPGMAGFREAARIVMLGFAPAAMLAGAGVNWLRAHAWPVLIPVLLAAALEAGWSGNTGVGMMRTTLPAVDGPIAADHSASIVTDVPCCIRCGFPLPGEVAGFNPEAQVLATGDGHPRSIAYLSRIPVKTLTDMLRHPFYADLLALQQHQRPIRLAIRSHHTQPLLAAARLDARRMGIGWVIVWKKTPGIGKYLARVGFRYDYYADGVLVYRSTTQHGR